MSSISLENSIRTCKVDQAYANKWQSDRFLNSDTMMCPVWNNRDNYGRPVCKDSFATKREGCNTAMDRIDVENALRPQYMEYINLDAGGLDGNVYKNVDYPQGTRKAAREEYGTAGEQYVANVEPFCRGNYQKAINEGYSQSDSADVRSRSMWYKSSSGV